MSLRSYFRRQARNVRSAPIVPPVLTTPVRYIRKAAPGLTARQLANPATAAKVGAAGGTGFIVGAVRGVTGNLKRTVDLLPKPAGRAITKTVLPIAAFAAGVVAPFAALRYAPGAVAREGVGLAGAGAKAAITGGAGAIVGSNAQPPKPGKEASASPAPKRQVSSAAASATGKRSGRKQGTGKRGPHPAPDGPAQQRAVGRVRSDVQPKAGKHPGPARGSRRAGIGHPSSRDGTVCLPIHDLIELARLSDGSNPRRVGKRQAGAGRNPYPCPPGGRCPAGLGCRCWRCRASKPR